MNQPAHRLLRGALLVLLGLPAVAAAEPTPDRPVLPSSSLAGEDGAHSLWVNPANLALDPDAAWYIGLTQEADVEASGQLATSLHAGPLATGLAYTNGGVDSLGAEQPGWLVISNGLGLKLDRDLAVGAQIGWQIPDGPDNNFATWDAGATWRPLDWLGVAAVARNIGSTREELPTRYGPGLVLRPMEDTLLVGVDWLSGADDVTGRVQGTVRLVPVDGLVLRFTGDQEGNLGGGIEAWFGRGGVGAHAHVPTGGLAPSATVYGATSAPENHLLRQGRQVAEFVFDQAYPYQPVGGIFARPGESYLHLLDRMRQAAEDPRVDGMVLYLDSTPFSLAQIEELRGAVALARQKGKVVVAYIDKANSNGAYLLASSADKVYMHPAAELELIGLSMEMQYLRGAMDLVGVGAQFSKRADYKSAPETFTRTGGSEASREQMNALLDDISKAWVESIAQGRKKSPDQIRDLVDQGPFSAKEAVEHGLIDELLYPDQLGERYEEIYDGPNVVDDYGAAGGVIGWSARREIAVIHVEGAIISGESVLPGFFGGGRSTGADTVIRQIEQAAGDDSVKAVVLRVDSPGGSAFASDEIWRALEKLKEEGKPYVVSMGGLAASGGYYVSAGATAIYANPSTITGSIGVYSGKYDLEGLFDRIGIETELYNRGRRASMWSLSKPMDDSEFAAMDRLVGETYAQFKERVGDGRKLKPEQVEEVARGRVWSGSAASGRGLVDELGGFHAAVERARKEAGITERQKVELITYGSRPGPDGELPRRDLSGGVRVLLPPRQDVAALLPPELALLRDYQRLSQDRIWALSPYSLEIK